MDAFKSHLAAIAAGAPLSREQARAAFDDLLSGEVTPIQAGAVLPALAVRGESEDEIVGTARPVHHQRVVAGGGKSLVDAAEDALRLVPDRRNLAVHGGGRPHDIAAIGLPDGLEAEADAEDWDLGAEFPHGVETDPGLVGRAGPGREHECVRRPLADAGDVDRVVAHHVDAFAERADQVDEIPGEGVVVVDDEDVGHRNSAVAPCVPDRPSS